MSGDPFRLKVLKALTLALQGITPANGYAHDLSAAVFRGRIVYGKDDPLPMVSILEPPMPQDQLTTAGASLGDWDLLIQGFVKDNPKNPTDPGYALLADVKRRLAIAQDQRDNGRTPNVLGLGGGKGKGNEIISMEIGSGIVRPADEVSATTYFWLTVTFKLAEDLKNPFA